ncbi:LANO_0H02872g1_1 [Lachancea nothofagi CBS 11611]|uniref:LANO_0H02872g1_1 n=1 Tax=Lachancea nothofagi CBS 11611 TaxID=1266666 RepID=A0A1G4KL60_9SACH|nr:LANO_0H02872g1_1 [Lachancea nothofagi CBS 11611]
MSSSQLKIDLKRYSTYLDVVPAPQGFQTIRGPTVINKWKHYQAGSAMVFLVDGEKPPKTMFLELVLHGTVMEQLSFSLEHKLDRNLVQFSARYPAVMCKYLITVNGVVFMRRFQIGLDNTLDFGKCCRILQSVGFVIKAAGVLQQSQLPQNTSTSILSSQYTQEKPYSTPPNSQLLETRILNPPTFETPADGNRSYNHMTNQDRWAKQSQTSASLDTQCFSQEVSDSLDLSLVQDVYQHVPAAQEPRPSAFNLYAQNRESKGTHTSDLRYGPHAKASIIQSGPQLQNPMPLPIWSQNYSQQKTSACTPVQSSQANYHSINTPSSTVFRGIQGDPNNPPQHGMEPNTIIKEKPRALSGVASLQASTDALHETQLNIQSTQKSFVGYQPVLSHPLEGLAPMIRPCVPQVETHFKDSKLNRSRPILTQDLIKEKLKDQSFRDWVCIFPSNYMSQTSY